MNPSLAICLPGIGSKPDGFVQSYGGQMFSLGLDGFDRMVVLTGSASTGAFRARNQIMQALELAEKQTGYRFDYTLWLDSDMTFPNKTAQALLRHKVDIVGATYKRRTPPFELMGKPLNGVEQTVRIGDLVEAEALPTGILLIKREIFDSIKKPIWKVTNSPDMSKDVGEDILFCQEARANGYKVWLDTTLTSLVGHLAEIPLFADPEPPPPSRIIMRGNGLHV